MFVSSLLIATPIQYSSSRVYIVVCRLRKVRDQGETMFGNLVLVVVSFFLYMLLLRDIEACVKKTNNLELRVSMRVSPFEKIVLNTSSEFGKTRRAFGLISWSIPKSICNIWSMACLRVVVYTRAKMRRSRFFATQSVHTFSLTPIIVM